MTSQHEWRALAMLFLKLGFTAFGGPAAHIAMMHDEVVKRRRWMTDEEFLDLLGATNLIPGPNSTEMAIHIGYRRLGWLGLLTSGLCFIVPAMLMVLGFAWAYVRFGARPEAAGLLYGVKPVMMAVILQALWLLGRKALHTPGLALVAAGAVAASVLAGMNEVAVLAFGGVLVLGVRTLSRGAVRMWSLVAMLGALPLPVRDEAVGVPFSLARLFWVFLKIGSVLYGSGYVLLAFLHGDFVERFGWLTDQQLLDAIAIGQLTPGPVFTTATFIGYLLGGVVGALVATAGIFLPSFIFVALSGPFVPRLRRSAAASAFLDGVNAAALGLMAVVTWTLARSSLVDAPTFLLGSVSLVLLMRFRVNTTWLIVGGALCGLWLA